MGISAETDQMPHSDASDLGLHYLLTPVWPALVAQLDACPSNLEVAGPAPSGSERFIHGDLFMKYFLQ